jgi:hypothetical protein
MDAEKYVLDMADLKPMIFVLKVLPQDQKAPIIKILLNTQSIAGRKL